MKLFSNKIILTLFVGMLSFSAFADPIDPPADDDPPPAPINVNLEYLAIMGALFACYTYKSQKKQV
jgi:hypothetical protein